MPDSVPLNDYDSEPVRYCARCYSLKIKYEEAIDSECCADCGSSDILEAPIETWEEKYERRYGHKFIVKNDDPRDSPIYKMPLKKLKMKLYEHPKWTDVVKALYPHFPKGLNREESILLLFDKLTRDNRINDLRLQMVKLIRNQK